MSAHHIAIVIEFVLLGSKRQVVWIWGSFLIFPELFLSFIFFVFFWIRLNIGFLFPFHNDCRLVQVMPLQF